VLEGQYQGRAAKHWFSAAHLFCVTWSVSPVCVREPNAVRHSVVQYCTIPKGGPLCQGAASSHLFGRQDERLRLGHQGWPRTKALYGSVQYRRVDPCVKVPPAAHISLDGRMSVCALGSRLAPRRFAGSPTLALGLPFLKRRRDRPMAALGKGGVVVGKGGLGRKNPLSEAQLFLHYTYPTLHLPYPTPALIYACPTL